MRDRTIKAFLLRRMEEGQLDMLALTKEAQEKFPLSCAGYQYATHVLRELRRRQAREAEEKK